MIELQDALERAKLAADGEGLISSYTYDRIVEQLDFADRHAFTMALVDLGIVTKHASMDDEEHMSHVLAMGSDSFEESKEDNRKASIVEDFVKVAQQFTQSPGGLWVPETYLDEDVQVEDSDIVDSQDYSSPESEQPAVKEPDFFEKYDVSHIQSVLEEYGVHVSAEGMVTLYSQNLPGLFNEKVPLRPMPLESAVELFTGKVTAIDKERGKIAELQDVLSSLNSDFSEIEGNLVSLSDKFNSAFGDLEKFNYVSKESDEIVQQISQGLGIVKQYLDTTSPHMEEMWGELRTQMNTISLLQSNLDQYNQRQYDNYDKAFELADALTRLSEIQGTAMFDEAISGLGGVVASFKSIIRKLEV